MSKDKRMKASDVFNQSHPFLGKTDSFAKAFPEIEDIRVEIKETGEGIPRWRQDNDISDIYTRNNLPGEYVDCSNPRCYNGGIRLGQIIRFMIDQKQMEYQDTLSCQGYEGSPKGRKKHDDCYNMFDVKITIKYKNNKDNRYDEGSDE